MDARDFRLLPLVAGESISISSFVTVPLRAGNPGELVPFSFLAAETFEAGSSEFGQKRHQRVEGESW